MSIPLQTRCPMVVLFLLWLSICAPAFAAENSPDSVTAAYLALVLEDTNDRDKTLSIIEDQWQDSLTPMTLESLSLSQNAQVRIELMALLQRKTGQQFGYDIDAWWQWVWQQDWDSYPHYAEFKSRLYGLIDPGFSSYFNRDHQTTIRLDEIRWGGVRQDGIPPLRQPDMISADQADYLEDDNIVFALSVDGDARAYPKRILAWHEMFVDTVGGEPVAGVYCTLCGTMILYKTTVGDSVHQLGTSGFLYRSNKLMYDKASQSLWSTFGGHPVVGPLVGRDIQLEHLSVVTTTWGEWRRRHPQTQVLSLDTGYRRDYSEGAAYRRYFATDDLMFTVPEIDTRLKNKDEILGLRLSHAPDQPLAIASRFLRGHPVYHSSIADQNLVVLTDASGAHRVYEAGKIKFVRWDQEKNVTDEQGRLWGMTEGELTSPDGQQLKRLPSHNAFWFGWYSAYRQTRLIY